MTNTSRKLPLTDDETLADVIECLTAEVLDLEIKLLSLHIINFCSNFLEDRLLTTATNFNNIDGVNGVVDLNDLIDPQILDSQYNLFFSARS